MPDYSFDQFLGSVADALANAQATVRRRCQRLFQRRFGCSDSSVATFSVPTWTSDGWRTLEIPMIDLMQRREIGISELDLELDCELRVQPAGEAGEPRRVSLRVGHPGAHTLRIRLRGVDAPRGEIFLDDVLLRQFSGADVNGASIRAVSSIRQG